MRNLQECISVQTYTGARLSDTPERSCRRPGLRRRRRSRAGRAGGHRAEYSGPPRGGDRARVALGPCQSRRAAGGGLLAVPAPPPERAAARLTADLDELERQTQHVLADHSGPVVLAGDVNINLADGSDGTAARRLRELLCTYTLRRHVRGPTFEPAASAIDILCSTTDAARAGSLSCDFSPHRWLRALISVPEYRPAQCSLTARCWGKFDAEEANQRLHGVDWSPVFMSAEPASQWGYFVNRTLPVLDSLAPLKRLKIRNPTAPPVTEATKLLMAERRSCLRAGDRARYRELNRQVKSAIRRDTRQDVQRRIQESGSGGMWRAIRPVVSGKRVSRPTPDADPDAMNMYFASIGTQIARQVDSSGPELPVRLPRVTTGAFQVQTVTPESLANTVARMSNSSACGADGLSVRFIKLCLPSLVHVITHIVNSSLAFHTVPRSWKLTLIHPIQKNPRSTDTSNYGPIAILPTIAKITERIVYEQLYSYLSVHHLLSPCQHGFRTNHSTETTLLTMTDRVYEAMDRRQVALCMLDLSKCFDVISHDRLLVKLQQYGIDIRWFSSYLADHYQQVMIRTHDGHSTLSQPLINPIGTYTRLQTVWSLPGHSRQANKDHIPRCHRCPNGPGRLADKVVQPTTQSAEGCTRVRP